MNTNYSTLYNYQVEPVILLNLKTLTQEQEYYEYVQEYCEASSEVQEIRISLQPPPSHLTLLFVQIIIQFEFMGSVTILASL
jgi:hypothetical protein